MKKIEQINWMWMKRNLHEAGFEKLIDKINQLIDRANGVIEEETNLPKESDASE